MYETERMHEVYGEYSLSFLNRTNHVTSLWSID